MVIAAQVPSGLGTPDGQAYDVKSKVDELLAAQAVVGNLDATELGFLNGVVAGTSAASKAVVLDVAGAVDVLEATDLRTDGLTINSVLVTATAADLNAVTGKDVLALTTVAGNVLAIPVTHRMVWKTTDVDAEVCTLANGTHGQVLTVFLEVDGGGAATLTPTSTNGFTSITLDDVGDQVTLQYFTGLGWVIVGAAGYAAPPVINA